MLTYFKNHWGQEIERLLYKLDTPEKMDAGKVKAQFEKDFLKDLKLPTDKNQIKTYINGTFDQKYGPTSYEAAFRKVVEKYIKDTGVREALIKESVSRYKDEYSKLRKQLANKLKDRLDVRNEAISGIRKATRKDLGTLVEAVEKGNQTNVIRHNIENGAKIEGKQVVNLTHALNRQYFNMSLLGSRLKPQEVNQYKNLSWQFKQTMTLHAQRQVQNIVEKFKDSKKRNEALKALAKGLEERYKTIANNDGIIDYHELKKLNEQAQKRLDLINLINSNKSNEEIIRQLEANQTLKPSEWVKGGQVLVIQFATDARRNGNEGRFIAFAKKKTGINGNMSFNSAVGHIRTLVKRATELGIREGLKIMQELNQEVNKKRADILEMTDIKPDSIHGMVRKERDRLLARRLIPKDPDAMIVVDFMSGNIAGRKAILKDFKLRAQLFQAIKNIQQNYTKEYNKNWKRGIPKKAGDLRYSTVLSKPTSHDKAARLLAVLTLAKEAEWTVGNYSTSPDHKKDDLTTEFENTTAKKTAPQIDLRFRDPQKKYEVKYLTKAARGGFNGRDLVLGAAKVWAGATILMNLMNYRREKMLAKALTNPYLLAAAGTIYGIKKYQNNPEVKNYLRETAGGQEKIKTHIALNDLSKKVRGGENTLKSFVHDANEFNAIHVLTSKSKYGKPNKPILKALKKAQVRAQKAGRKPTLSREDLKQALASISGGDDAYYRLPAKGNDRMRYLFYSKFLTVGRSGSELQNHTADWPKKVIS